jgi:thiamine biosynthesis lipoprotein ApbE
MIPFGVTRALVEAAATSSLATRRRGVKAGAVTARVIAADRATADALATALTVAPDTLSRLRRRFQDTVVSLVQR